MKQILQNLKNGQTVLEEIPRPQVKPGNLLIKSEVSLISTGTERMLVDFGKANLVEKARQQPDKVKQVLNKIKTDGLVPTVQAVRSKLDQAMPLGYCNVGTVIEMKGPGLEGFNIGDRVASNGPHAEYVCVPKNLCAIIPENVSNHEAAFTVPGSIALNGVRLLHAGLGDNIIVMGLGLIGQLSLRLLIAQGCRVLGMDLDSAKCEIAANAGAEVIDLGSGYNPVESAIAFSRNKGVDGVIIAAATKSSEPVNQAAEMCRKRGCIVQVGSTGLNLMRDEFYKKEISLQVACSYGPGRYDPIYEQKGMDYPYSYVRWTEQRNFEAILNLMESGKLDINKLITHRLSFSSATKAYEKLSSGLGIILEYGDAVEDETDDIRQQTGRIEVSEKDTIQINDSAVENIHPHAPVIGLAGAGNYTGQVLLPAITRSQARLKVIASSGGVTGTHLGKKFGFEVSTTDTDSIFKDPEINTVIITTRHNTHARYVLEALKAEKNVFVEKPLCLTLEELDQIKTLYGKQQRTSNPPLLMVGFNRRFAPHIVKMKELVNALSEPVTMIMTVNAGIIPLDHWHHDPMIGGGRILAEGCHFIDLLRFIIGHPIAGIQAQMLGRNQAETIREDKMTITMSFSDGSHGTIHYFGNGSKAFPKERLEIFGGGRVIQMDNFKKMSGFDWPGFKKQKLMKQDKGHARGINTFLECIKSGSPSPIPFEEIVEVMKATFEAVEKASV